jgi:hypothetical protein
VDVGGMGLPRLTSLLLVVGIGILNRTLGLGAAIGSEARFLGSVAAGVGSVVTGPKALVVGGEGSLGSSRISCSVDGSSSDSGWTIAVGRRLQFGL